MYLFFIDISYLIGLENQSNLLLNLLVFDENEGYRMRSFEANISGEKPVYLGAGQFVYGNGIFIEIIGLDVLISGDGGRNWKKIPQTLRDVVFCKYENSNIGIFLAACWIDKKLYTSLDGVHWKPISYDPPYFESICSANGLVVGVFSKANRAKCIYRSCTDDEVKELIAKDMLIPTEKK
jgi:hypothetical protein